MTINMRTEPKSDQMNYDDFIGNKTKTITITDVRSTESQNDQQPISIHYDGDEGKPYKPCKSMRRVLVDGWGTDGLKYVGKSLTLFGDPNVTWGGQAVGGIRISHLSHIDKPIKSSLTATRGQRKLFVVQPLVLDMGNVEEEVDSDELLIEAREFCKGGKENFVTWFNTLNQAQRDIVKTKMDELQKLCKEADNKDVDPFATTPTEEAEPDTSRDQTGETVAKEEPEKVPDNQQAGSSTQSEEEGIDEFPFDPKTQSDRRLSPDEMIETLDIYKSPEEVRYFVHMHQMFMGEYSTADHKRVINARDKKIQDLSNA